MENAKPLTIGDFKRLMAGYLDNQTAEQQENIFSELHDQQKENPKYLQ
ncbi:hypothetical protein [Lederbergia citrea]